MAILFKTLCMMKICSCPKGTHAWNALRGEDEHMEPHDPGSKFRAEAYIHNCLNAVHDIRLMMGRDVLTGEPWSTTQHERSTHR